MRAAAKALSTRLRAWGRRPPGFAAGRWAGSAAKPQPLVTRAREQRSMATMTAPLERLTGRDSYVGSKKPVTFIVGSEPEDPGYVPAATLIWFPGSGQRNDNELLRRFANALHEVGLRLIIHAVDKSELLEGIVSAAVGPVLLGGHSAGGSMAGHFVGGLAHKHKRVVGLVTINSFSIQDPAPAVPSLAIVGQNDGYRRMLPKDAYPGDHDMVFSMQKNGSTLLVAREGDHSIRFNTGAMDKDACSCLPETHEMNLAVASEVKRFIEALDGDCKG